MAVAAPDTIASLKAKIETANKKVAEFVEALELLKGGVKYTPVPGTLEPFDKMQAIMKNAQSEKERAENLEAASQALAVARDERAQLQTKLAQMEAQLKFDTTKQRFEAERLKYQAAIAQAAQAWTNMAMAKKEVPAIAPTFPAGTFYSVAQTRGVQSIDVHLDGYKIATKRV